MNQLLLKIISPGILLGSILLLQTSFRNKPVSSKVHLVVMPMFIKGELQVNDKRLKIKERHFAEFEIQADSIRFSLDIKLPLAYKNPAPLNIKSTEEMFLAITEKKLNLLTVEVGLDTICKSCYYELKAKCRKQIFPQSE